jgi:hypothetical protein
MDPNRAVEQMSEIASMAISGAPAYEPPLKALLESLEAESVQEAHSDIVFITADLCRLDKRFEADFSRSEGQNRWQGVGRPHWPDRPRIVLAVLGLRWARLERL